MVSNNIEFKYACKEFLSGFALNALRAYARDIGVSNPTKDKKKNVLIEEIVAVLVGDVEPQAPSVRGAPVKNNLVDPKLSEGIQHLRMLAAANEKAGDSDIRARLQELKKNPHVLTVQDPNAEMLKNQPERELYRGQLETLNGVSMLLPLNCMDSEKKVIISVETIRAYDLREGDMITCYAEKRQSVLVATAIMTVNDYVVDTFKRGDFETKPVCFPKEKIIFHENGKGTVARKLLQWLLPIGQGQRGLIFGAPKTGKSTLLADMHLASTVYNPGINVYSLLIDQSPEVVAHFRKTYGKDNVVYTTYEDEPERQVFVADFILKRAKRMAECGRDVLLFVDSFNALARAYNDTDASTGGKVLAGGLESKTVQYLKRYLGTARCFESGGAITIIGSLSTDTGNPADDLLRSELTPIANLEMTLDEKLARQRLYPAFDLLKVRGKFEDASPSSKEDVLWKFICNQYLPAYGWEGVLELFQENDTLRGLQKNAIDKIKEYHK